MMISTCELFNIQHEYNVRNRIGKSECNAYDNLNVREGYKLLTSFYNIYPLLNRTNNIISSDACNIAINAYDNFMNTFFTWDVHEKMKYTSQKLIFGTFSARFPLILSELTGDKDYLDLRKNNSEATYYYIENMPGFSDDLYVDKKYDTVHIKSNIMVIYTTYEGVIITEKYFNIDFSYYNDFVLYENTIKPIMFYKTNKIKYYSDFNDYITNLAEKDEAVIEKLKEEYVKLIENGLTKNLD